VVGQRSFCCCCNSREFHVLSCWCEFAAASTHMSPQSLPAAAAAAAAAAVAATAVGSGKTPYQGSRAQTAYCTPSQQHVTATSILLSGLSLRVSHPPDSCIVLLSYICCMLPP
jgi:hypothetical protein